MTHEKNDERGFILVTSLILLSILTMLGAVSFYKSNIAIKVSASSIEMEQAYAAMNVGLGKTYADWSANSGAGSEFKAIGDWVASKTGTNPAIYVNSYPSKVADLAGANPPAGARIYTLGATGVPATGTAWGGTKDPQVAIWVTSFEPQAGSGYPYATSNYVTTTSCPTCALVVYALGRSGDARRLGREYMSTVTQTIEGYGAMVNAPKFKNESDRCSGTTSTSSLGTTALPTTGLKDKDGNAVPMINGSHLIDSTQAPGGIAIASNNSINWPSSSKLFNPDTASSAKNINPYVVFDPGKVTALTKDYPEIDGGLITNVSASVMSADRFASDYMNYFDSASDQLFQLDAYREAANRIAGFPTEMIGAYKVDTGGGTTIDGTTAGTSLGNYSTLKANNSNHARMGTIQWLDLAYNIENDIPMYGIVRLMLPVKLDKAEKGNGSGCGAGNDPAKFKISHDPLAGGTNKNGKLIVYGGALFDFYYDTNTNDIYEPGTDRLLTPQEAMSFKVNVDSPLMFNPVMDDVGGTNSGPRTGATACTDYTQIDCYPNGSPSWDLTSDKLSGGDGVMDLIGDVDYVARNWATKVHTGTAYVPASAPGFKYQDWMTGEPVALGSAAWGSTGVATKADLEALLDYYIRTTANGVTPDWNYKTLATIEDHHTTFKIHTKSDLVDSPSAADLYHTFLPSGYIHGWKRAMMVTGLASESSTGSGKSRWNEKLIGSGSPFYDTRNTYFNLNGYGNAAKVDKTFADIPAEMYAGGLVDMHQIVNTSGVVYTPGQLELEQKIQNGFQALQYINGIIITGHGTYFKQESGAPNALTIIVYDDTSIDNLPTKKATLATGRKYWQELK